MVDITYGTGLDYQELHGGTVTGYYTKKFLNNMSWKSPTTYTHACPIFRYAEVLLNAAEALNEAGRTSEAYEYVNQVRARVGMPAYSNMTQDKLRERIRNERRIELCLRTTDSLMNAVGNCSKELQPLVNKTSLIISKYTIYMEYKLPSMQVLYIITATRKLTLHAHSTVQRIIISQFLTMK